MPTKENEMKNVVLVLLTTLVMPASWAKLNVLTTTSDLAALAKEVGGDDVSVESIAKGTQDQHFIEAKPSYMVKASKADLVVAIGLELEIGWLPSIVRGARNPKIIPGAPGYFEVGPTVNLLDKPTGEISRTMGDVHPDGNPHVALDPIRMGMMGIELAKKMASLDPAHATGYEARAKAFQKRMEDKTKLWKERIKKSGVKEVVTYHKTLTYFLDRFSIKNEVFLEPKPGIPPTATHLIEVVNLIKTRKIPLVLIENFFDLSAGKRIASEVKGVRVESVAVAVGGAPGITKLDDMYEALVKSLETK